MFKNENELMMKMCASENDGVGVKVDGVFYFYENYKNDDAISRVYRHFGGDRNITFYAMSWARQQRIHELMSLYIDVVASNESMRADGIASVIANYIVAWSHFTKTEALEQIHNMQIHYPAIA